jgi:hypothetical protein
MIASAIISLMKLVRPYDIPKAFFRKSGEYSVYVVDDEAIRNRAVYAEEFSNWGVNTGTRGLSTVHFPFIPYKEIWIGRSVKPRERSLIVADALQYVALIEKGVPSHEAYDRVLAVDQKKRTLAMRRRFGGDARVQKIITDAPRRIPKDVYIRSYAHIRGGDGTVTVYVVDGTVVRGLYQTDFVEGGHSFVYPWVPKKEVWIDDGISESEIPVIVLHEFVERELMRERGMPYVQAHEIALRVEFKHRGTFTKKDVGKLNWRFAQNTILRGIRTSHLYKKQ